MYSWLGNHKIHNLSTLELGFILRIRYPLSGSIQMLSYICCDYSLSGSIPILSYICCDYSLSGSIPILSYIGCDYSFPLQKQKIDIKLYQECMQHIIEKSHSRCWHFHCISFLNPGCFSAMWEVAASTLCPPLILARCGIMCHIIAIKAVIQSCNIQMWSVSGVRLLTSD